MDTIVASSKYQKYLNHEEAQCEECIFIYDVKIDYYLKMSLP